MKVYRHYNSGMSLLINKNYKMKNLIFYLSVLLLDMTATVAAQVPADTLTQKIRSYTARNFSEFRTFNMSMETVQDHDYTWKQNGQKMENGKIHNDRVFKFSVTRPVLLIKNFSIYANVQFDSYHFDATNKETDNASSVFSKNSGNYSYFIGSISGTYNTKIANKPLFLTVSGSEDGGNIGFEKTQGTVSAIVMLKRSATTNFSVGLYGMTLYQNIPVLPIIVYWHQFNPHLNIDVTLPSSAYLRYQFCNNQRISIGTTLDNEHFYLKPDLENLPKVCYYSNTIIKPEIVYEYIINKHFYLTAHAGGVSVIKGGLYGTNRKGAGVEPYIKYSHPMTTFFNIGISYNFSQKK